MNKRLKWPEVLKRINRGVPFLEPFHGGPKCFLSVAPKAREIVFKIKASDKVISKNTHKNLEILEAKGGKEIHLKCTEKDLFPAFYEICNIIADAVQIKKLRPLNAIKEALLKFENILQKQKQPTRETILGLLGELYFFVELLEKNNGDKVMSYWTGVRFEEHDFTCQKVDIEVKTTTKDEREHRITSLNQLRPKDKRKLFLISYMVTPGQGKNSFSLLGLLNTIQRKTKLLGIKQQILDRISVFVDDLNNCKYIHQQYVLRRKPCCFPVNNEFPQITNKTLKTNLNQINDVSYTIYLDGLNENNASTAYAKIVGTI